MSDTVIRVENLGKLYRIGLKEKAPRTLRKAVTGLAGTPFKYLRSVLREPTAEEVIWSLKDVSFEVKQGEVVGIIGRNGAGKSTLLKILSQITEPSCGYAEIRGRVGSLLEVGTGFHPDLTGRENTYLNGTIMGMKRREIDRRFDEIVAFAEVEKFIDTPVKFYSSGMYTRLAFAVAAHLEPEILIVDEVLAVGDINFQKKCLGKMQDVSTKEGRTVLFVSHNMGAVSSLCSKAVYLARGQVKAIGPVFDILTEFFINVSSKETGDLAQWRVPGPDYGKFIRFFDIQLVSNTDAGLLFGQPLKYEIKIHSNIDIKDINIGSSIFDVSGTCIGSFITDSFSIKADQRLVLYLDVSNLNLAPGSYYAGFSIGHGGKDSPRRELDGIVGKPCFQILPFSRTDEQAANWNSKWGWVVFRDVELSISEAQIYS